MKKVLFGIGFADAVKFFIGICICCTAVGCTEKYIRPEAPIKSFGYLVVDKPSFLYDINENLARWLDDYRKKGYEVVDCNFNGRVVFKKTLEGYMRGE